MLKSKLCTYPHQYFTWYNRSALSQQPILLVFKNLNKDSLAVFMDGKLKGFCPKNRMTILQAL